jgi:hypothetical protein
MLLQQCFQGFEYLLNPQLPQLEAAETRILTLLCQFGLSPAAIARRN